LPSRECLIKAVLSGVLFDRDAVSVFWG